MALLTWICRMFEFSTWPDLSRFYPDLMSYYYLRGLSREREKQLKENAPLGGRGGQS